MEIYAIIPARGGSKGIIGKNVAEISGYPLIFYTIHHALNTPEISKVVVTTDDKEIASLSLKYGAKVIDRPRSLSTDSSPSEDALLHALQNLRSNNEEPDLIVFLQATSPLRRQYDTSYAVKQFIDTNADPIETYIWKNSAGKLSPFNYDPQNRMMRQQRSDLFEGENGSIYIFKPWVLEKLNCRIGGKIVTYQMDILSSLQIDEHTDIEVAETLLDNFPCFQVNIHSP